jgi:hypothetical protein
MGGANPNVDPGQPLPDGQPVNVPTGGGGGGAPPSPPGGSPPQPPGGLPPQPPGGGGGAGGGIPISIIWDFKLTKPADKSYCYISTGDGTWDKMPKEPFDFFQGLDNLYTQLLDGNVHAHMVLQADCWGWQGGVLEYLGQGQTQFDFGQALVQLVLNADGFQLIGTPQFPPGNTPEAGMILPQIEAPYALREPTSTQDCLSHGGGSFDCDTALNAPLKTDMVLQWEWQPGVHWPGDPSWITAIDGYDLFEIDPSTNAQQLMGEVTPAGVKVGSLPLPWGPWCYGVQAYADDPQYGGKVVSALTEYCPGTPPTMQHLDATPTEWVTRGHTSWDIGDCPTNNYYDEAGDSGVNVNSAAVLVGSWIQKGGGCEIRQGNYWAGVKFNVSLPPGAVLQKATLKFNLAALLYGATHVALGASPTSCAADVGVAQLDWSALSTYPFYSESAYAFYPVYSAPFTSIGGGQADVTAIVADWLSHPGNNHGFFLTPAESLMPQPLDVEDNGGSGLCLSWLHNFGLYYEYFAP